MKLSHKVTGNISELDDPPPLLVAVCCWCDFGHCRVLMDVWLRWFVWKSSLVVWQSRTGGGSRGVGGNLRRSLVGGISGEGGAVAIAPGDDSEPVAGMCSLGDCS